jgi:hypothetical protein
VLSFGSYVGVACIREAVIFFPSWFCYLTSR